MNDGKAALREMLPDYLNQLGIVWNGKNFRCPNPAHDDQNPSAGIHNKSGFPKVHCFACCQSNISWDIFDLVAMNEFGVLPNVDGELDYNFRDVFQRTNEIMGTNYTSNTYKSANKAPKISSQTQRKASNADNYKQAAREAQIEEQIKQKNAEVIAFSERQLYGDDQNGLEYLVKRSITSDKLLKQFHIGYNPAWRSETVLLRKGIKAPLTPRIIIPTGPNSYLARDIREDIPENERAYVKQKEGEAHLFNAEALKPENVGPDKPIFVVEGELDALSVMEAGGQAVALGSVQNTDLLAHEITKIKQHLAHSEEKEYHPIILIALDNDKAGKRASKRLYTKLKQGKVLCYEVDIVRNHKDPNEALVANGAKFAEDVKRVMKDPQDRLQGFLNYIKDQENIQSIPTGFENLDNVLDGGLREGLYVIGALSSLGKTTFALQIADYIAEHTERSVLYFALEMGQYEMTAKTLSRLTFYRAFANGDETLAQSARSLLDGKWKERFNKDQYNNVKEALDHYGNFYYNITFHDGSEERPNVYDISNKVEEYVSSTGKKPVIFVDYLQIMAAANDKATDKANVTTSVNELKKLATRFHIPVILISSFNRENYKNTASMVSFKESGEIEYSSDVLIGLQFKGIREDQNFDFETARKKDPREIEAIILKNRNGATGDILDYDYYPKYNLYMATNREPDVSELLAIRKKYNPVADEDGQLLGTRPEIPKPDEITDDGWYVFRSHPQE